MLNQTADPTGAKMAFVAKQYPNLRTTTSKVQFRFGLDNKDGLKGKFWWLDSKWGVSMKNKETKYTKIKIGTFALKNVC